MQEARPGAVLGKFNGSAFTYAGVASKFFRRGDRFVVNTEGADGKLHDFEIRYTFGVYPLQQYLVAFPDGRMQPLPSPGTRGPAAEGGQRWFHLNPGPRVTHTDELHWTGRQQNWNFMCADCHSTGVRKGYDRVHGQIPHYVVGDKRRLRSVPRSCITSLEMGCVSEADPRIALAR